jgi:hypothetical protein
MEPFKKTSLKKRLERMPNSLIKDQDLWRLSAKDKEKGQNRHFYNAKKILERCRSFIKYKADPEIGIPEIRKSAKGVFHLTWYRPDLKIALSICWFAGSKEKSFRGFKVFWPYPSSKAKKKHFQIPCEPHEEESDLPAKVQIEIVIRELTAWVLDPSAFPDYPRYSVERVNLND